MAARYTVDDGGAVAFRNSPDMSDKSEQIAKAGAPIVCQARSGSGVDAWVQHTNGLWLPLRFLVPVDATSSAPPPAEENAARSALFAGAKPKPAAKPEDAARSALFAGAKPPQPAPSPAPPPAEDQAEAAAASAAEAAKVAQQARLERLPSAPEAPPPEPAGLRLSLDLNSPGAELPGEPHLKYLRLGGKVADSLRRTDPTKAERATDLDVNDKLLTLATEKGAIHVLDLSGGPIRRFDVHTMPVHAVHIDASGEHIASCSNEGRVVIHELYGHETQTFDYGEALTCVRLAPAYARQPELAVGSFDGHVRLKNKNWFGQMKDEDVLADRGRIEEIAWQGSGAFLAWGSDAGVKVWDCRTRQMMGHVSAPAVAGEGGGSQNRCCLCWADDRILLIGWGATVQIIEIKDRDSTPGVVRRTDSAGLPDFTVTVST